ncbi:MAG: MltA domain-containing protein [Phycisphaerae bacterium]
MKIASLALVASLAVSLLAGCPKNTGTIVGGTEPDYNYKLPPGKLGLSKVALKDWPDFTQACSDLTDLRKAIDCSLHYMQAPSSKQAYARYGPEFTHERTVATLKAMGELVDQRPTPEQMNAAIRDKFDLYTSVGWNGQGEVHFTGYYTPIFDASATPTERFKYPLYKEPADLKAMRGPDGTLQGSYPTRKELETTQKARLAGQELYYLDDPFSVYIVQIQGSAKLRVDGKLVTVGYTADNGRDYHSIALDLVEEGKIPKGKLSLQSVMAYFKAHPDEVSRYTWKNDRFVFFAESQGDPRGCLNEPVTPWRTVATDKDIFPRACVTFIKVGMPKRGATGLIDIIPDSKFTVDQDRGGAIRAPGRCDLYMGVGDEAGEMAGREYENGRLYYLAIKPSLMATYAGPAAPTPVSPAPPGP